MFCPYCGRDIPNNVTICPACRGVVSETMLASYFQEEKKERARRNRNAEYQPEVYHEHPAEEPELEKEPKRRKWPLVLVAIIIVALLAFIAVPLLQEAAASNKTDHRVTFLMKTPGYNDEATAIPVHVKGTKTDGSEYDELVYLDGGGNGISLDPGEYVLTFPGGSILSNGTVLVAPKKSKIEVTVPEGLARNEFVQVPTNEAVSYKAVAPLDLTDKTLEAVYKYAVDAPNDNGKAAKLRENAIKAREDAQSKKEAETDAIEKETSGNLKVSLGDEAKFLGTFEICSAEDVAKRLGDDNITWNLGGQTLAVLWLEKPRKVTVETSTTDDYDGYNLYFDEDDGLTYTDTQEYEVRCLVFSTDVEGIYSAPDDGTLSAHDGKTVLATGHVNMPSDWTSSLVSPISLASPTLEDL